MDTVISSDGTNIAYERTGRGPPLVLVHGSAGDHSRWELGNVRASFAEHCTVYAVDRRGRGESGDAAEYSLEREFEDIATVVEAIDEPVNLLGHSYGALVTLGAALRTDNLRTLIVYEPDCPWEIVGPHLYAGDVAATLDSLIAAGENEQALLVFLHDVVELPDAQIKELQSAPSWAGRVEAAHTLGREYRAPTTYEFDAAGFADMTIPTLLLVGGDSPHWAHEATDAIHKALPKSQISVLTGHGHVAMNTAPELFVDEVLTFIRKGCVT